ncbi:MAG: cytochrome c family protein [Bacteroidota bacterium]
MKPLVGLLAALVIFLFTGGMPEGGKENRFVGTKKCAACHKSEKLGGTAYTVWEKSAHAGAYKTLLGDAAKKIAREKGLSVPPSEAPECLRCHVTGGGTAKNVDASFKKEEGVGCETCHGAASGYLMVHNKKNSTEKAVAAGLVRGAKEAKSCTVCHNDQSPTFKGFTFDAMWAKVEHARKK